MQEDEGRRVKETGDASLESAWVLLIIKDEKLMNSEISVEGKLKLLIHMPF